MQRQRQRRVVVCGMGGVCVFMRGAHDEVQGGGAAQALCQMGGHAVAAAAAAAWGGRVRSGIMRVVLR